MEYTNNTLPAKDELKTWFDQNPAVKLTDAIWKLESNINFMEDGLSIMEELMEPLTIARANQLNLIELTQNQARALYGSLTYLQLIHEKLAADIRIAYTASNDALTEAAGVSKPQMTEAQKHSAEEIERLTLSMRKAIDKLEKE